MDLLRAVRTLALEDREGTHHDQERHRNTTPARARMTRGQADGGREVRAGRVRFVDCR